MKVFKFGGASVKDYGAVQNLGRILDMYSSSPLLVVISAMGKMTNALELLLNLVLKGQKEDAKQKLSEISSFHLTIAFELFEDKNHPVFEIIRNYIQALEDFCNQDEFLPYDIQYDSIVCYGELLSTAIVSQYLNDTSRTNVFMDARKLIETDNTWRNARIFWDETTEKIRTDVLPILSKGNSIVTQGFIGADKNGNSTTLGREGSDFSAAIFAFAIDADDVTIWKDVPGVLNADPKYYPNAVKLGEISYEEAVELAYYGATIIHPKTIKPLENKQIPLYVKSFINPKTPGSVIQNPKDDYQSTPSYIFKINQVLISISPRDFSFIAEDNLKEIFEVFGKYGLRIHLMQNSAVSFSVVTDDTEGRTLAAIEELMKQYRVRYNTGLMLTTIRHYNQETIAKVLQCRTILLEQRSRVTVQFVTAESSIRDF
ncbi:MAG: aspartate kinase [Bacteroidales bacterium]|nr:aspartate kinase [Bacteroidales bacterium]